MWGLFAEVTHSYAPGTHEVVKSWGAPRRFARPGPPGNVADVSRSARVTQPRFAILRYRVRMSLMNEMPCIDFLPNEIAAGELRGAQAFRNLASRNPEHRERHSHGITTVHKPGNTAVTICGHQVLFMLMPSSDDNAEFIRLSGFEIGRAIVVDYYGDVLRLMQDSPRSPEMEKAGKTTSPETWEWWSAPERQAAMTKSLSFANVVTTPWAELVEPLRQFNDKVIHLPDWHGLGFPYLTGLTEVMSKLEFVVELD